MPSPSERDLSDLAALAAALRPAESAPEEIVRAAKAAWTWRTVDAELAALAYDSLVEPAGTRGPAAGTLSTMVFDAAGLTMVVEVGLDEITGQLCPAGAESVEVESVDGAVAPIEPVHTGWFRLTGLPGSTVRLRVTREGRPPMITPWFRAPLA